MNQLAGLLQPLSLHRRFTWEHPRISHKWYGCHGCCAFNISDDRPGGLRGDPGISAISNHEKLRIGGFRASSTRGPTCRAPLSSKLRRDRQPYPHLSRAGTQGSPTSPTPHAAAVEWATQFRAAHRIAPDAITPETCVRISCGRVGFSPEAACKDPGWHSVFRLCH